MTKVKTSSGFEYEIDEENLNDMRLLDLVAEISNGDTTKLPLMISMVLGDQKEKLYKNLEDEKGRVPIQKADDEITEIFTLVKTGKNS